MAQHYDLIVIGGGSGGSGIAKRAAGYGKKVCIIERGVKYVDGVRQGAGVGGTCVNVGCVPKKIMFMAAFHRELMKGHAQTASGYGFEVKDDMPFDWPGLKGRRDAYVKKLNGIYEGGWKKLGIELKTGFAKFTGPKAVSIAQDDGTSVEVTGDHICIATGGFPAVPDIPGKELAITSDGFFDLPAQPKKVAVIGAGYIAVEFAGIFHALGSDTTLFCRGETVLRRGFDKFIVDILMKEIRAGGPTLVNNATPEKLEKQEDGTITMTLKDGRTLGGFDTVVMAIGRAPAVEGLELKTAGVEQVARGHIPVDEYENTNVAGIYALGDVTTTGFDLTPVAIAAGRRLADRLFGGEPKARLDYTFIPTVVFSHPPIGTVGYTQQDAEAKFGAENIQVKEASFGCMFYALSENKVTTGLKLVLQGPEEKVVGLHLIGPFSDEMLQGWGVAVKMGATRRDFEASMAIHPTIGEELVTMGTWGQKDGKPLLPPQIQ